MKVKVTRNYQVTIPSKVRQELGVKEGDYVSIRAEGARRAVLKRVIPLDDLAGAWDEEMDRVMEEVRSLWKGWNL